MQLKEEQAKLKRIAEIKSTTLSDITKSITTEPKNYTDQIETLKKELQATKTRAERAERDKSDILLRSLASRDTSTNRTAASEALKLQQQVNELNQQLEDLKDEKRTLATKMRNLEQDGRSKSKDDDLGKKLKAAEQLCEELMDENEEMKKELNNMEREIDEMQDNFREEQVDENTTLKKELDRTTKNCRILTFKFKKSERRIEQLESEKKELSNKGSSELANKVKKLEDELRISNEVTRQLQVNSICNLVRF